MGTLPRRLAPAAAGAAHPLSPAAAPDGLGTTLAERMQEGGPVLKFERLEELDYEAAALAAPDSEGPPATSALDQQ